MHDQDPAGILSDSVFPFHAGSFPQAAGPKPSVFCSQMVSKEKTFCLLVNDKGRVNNDAFQVSHSTEAG
jgi:hypothetical protein